MRKEIIPNAFRYSSWQYEIDEETAKNLLRDLEKRSADYNQWEKRSEIVRKGILRAARLWPLPLKEDLKPIVRGKKHASGYTIENIAFESYPGFYCTGNLYRPQVVTKKNPAVLCPHGHLPEEGGRFSSIVQARCARLAQMGALVLAYDMVGWGESLQVSHQNRFTFSYQLWNSIRCLDFLFSLGDIDETRIGITGGSGGATQSIMLTAVDNRITLSVPVVMVSAHMYGGCICETGMPVHRISGTNNVEIAALAAPRPQLLISVGEDWTKNTPQREFPFIQRIYSLYQAQDMVENVHLEQEKHDYGPNKRRALYRFLEKRFDLSRIDGEENGSGEIPEKIKIFNKNELRVFNSERKLHRPMAEVLETELLN